MSRTRRYTLLTATPDSPGLDVVVGPDTPTGASGGRWCIADPRLMLLSEPKRREFIEGLMAAEAIDLTGAVFVPAFTEVPLRENEPDKRRYAPT